MAAGRGPAKTHHRAEAREQKHLVQLMPHVPAVRSGKNLIIHHLAVLIHGHVHEQTVRKRKFGFVLFGRPVAGIVGEREQFRRLHQIQRHIVLNRLH